MVCSIDVKLAHPIVEYRGIGFQTCDVFTYMARVNQVAALKSGSCLCSLVVSIMDIS